MLQVTGVHHVALITADYPRARRFYTEVLGCEVLAEHFRAQRQSWKLDLRLPGGVQLELFSFPDPPQRPTRPEACGLRHLALAVPDLDAALAWLAAHDVAAEPVRTDEYTGRRFSFFQDPDGLPLELYEAPGAPAAGAHAPAL
jgi:glyoxylase I family protein